MLDIIVCALIKVANIFVAVIFSWWIDILIVILELLPSSPMKFENVKWGSFGNFVGYFIPVQKMLTHFTMILTTLAVWYGLQHILRVLRMVR